MSSEEIRLIDEWFDEHDSFRTYHADDEYSVGASDMREFTEFWKESFDGTYIGIECMVGNNGIWFWEHSLKNAEAY